MKLQSLAVIFIIIIMPITMVLSEYINNKIKTQETELVYNTRLLNSTYDAIKAYQLNTINNEFGDITDSNVKDVLSAAKTFFNSLSSSFNYTGYNSDAMKEYVPAIVFTMYNGYYIYSPYTNLLTEVADDSYDKNYSENGKTHDGLKPYVSYSCRYTNKNNNTNLPDNTDFTITYTLDNYITIQGMIKGEYVYDYGYLYSIANDKNGKGIYKDGDTYWYDGVQFKETDTEELKEFVGGTEYSYAKINGKKYYLDESAYSDRGADKVTIGDENISKSAGIFYISSTTGEKDYSQTQGYIEGEEPNSTRNATFLKYYKAIKHNKSAFEYYKNAYEFSSAVLKGTDRTDKAGNKHSGGYRLSKLNSNDAIISNTSDDVTAFKGNVSIFDGSIEMDSSNFNQHKKEVIRNVIETNLKPAISSFSSEAVKDEFIMPKISDEDWEKIENNVCAISFMQGMNIGSKKYNGYSVVANTLTNEYIDENDIYILATDKNKKNIYCKVNDKTLGSDNTIKKKGTENDETTTTYYPGIWKINFESKQYIERNTDQAEGTNKPYFPIHGYGSYTSIMGSYGVNEIQGNMYNYVQTLEENVNNNYLKKVYYLALGRERWGSSNVNNGSGDEYFLNSY